MNRMGTRWRGKIPIPPHAHPLVRELITAANEQQTTITEIAGRTNMPRETISDWRYCRMPRVDNLVAAFNALDLDLAVVPLKDKRP